MKTKIIPFDFEIAEEIQKGKIKGKIKTRSGNSVRLVCIDLKKGSPIVGIVDFGIEERIFCFYKNGVCNLEARDGSLDLFLEVPEEEWLRSRFKPFDKVLVRQSDNDDWRVSFYSHFDPKKKIHVSACLNWYQCIPYEGNEHLVGTTDKPNE